MKLTDRQCRIAKPRERAFNLTDGGGLFLQVKPNGSKLWRCDYAFGGKRATANFGPYPITSLVQARHRRDEIKEKLRAGVDPTAKLDDDRPKFESVAREWFMVNKAKWESSYSTRVWSRIEDDILPVLGPKAIADIKPPEVLAVLRKVESREGQPIYTARRLHQFVSTVFKYAIAGGLVEINPAANLHPALKPVPRGKHRAALKESELPEFFRRLHGTPMDESTRLGLKGTIAHILSAMIGQRNTVAPTLASLETNFGLEPLIGKSVAIIGDARISAKADQLAIAERLLTVSGEDSITIDRKYMSTWTGRLPVRFLILSNELPGLIDASGAMASRFLLLRIKVSFLGKEDRALKGRLLRELPGILNWARAGYLRLNARGYFVPPTSAADAVEELEALGSPVKAFVTEKCTIGTGRRVLIDSMYGAWRSWCIDNGRREPGTKQTFSRNLHSAFSWVRTTRPREGVDRNRYFEGLDLGEDGRFDDL